MTKYSLVILCLMSMMACKKSPTSQFTELSSAKTNIDFENRLRFEENFNIYTYRNFYNGGGVAIGDINNDGLNDIYFTANMNDNQLYINQGNFQFKNATKDAGVAGEKAWSTGVSLVDVNTDGWLDIYVCNSGDVNGDDKQNELFINNQDGTFTERAEEYGLADKGFSTHAAFFDYDHDGDLDCYLLNNSYRSIGSFNLQKNERFIRDKEGGDKLYRNDNGKFVDVSEQAGIYGSVIGFGLGVTVGDINRDGWEDIFVSNDFFERDYLYVNQTDGSFKEELPNWMNSISAASMGADMVDLNNDFLPDLFVTEMLPEPNSRIKTKTTFESWDNYQFKLKNDYYHQFTRNMLQMNKGDEFAEVSRYAGVSATDWSWAALGADFDLDGNKEIFVANGIYQDLTDQDYIMYVSSNEAKNMVRRGHKEDFQRLIDVIPSVPISNYLFKQDSLFHYSNLSEQWGLSEPSHSNGSAYGDLDNDGDLDLVVNNVNMPAFIYRNNEKELRNTESITIELVGSKQNPFAYGAKVFTKDKVNQYIDVMPIRGFQSTMAREVILPKSSFDEQATFYVQWPTGQYSEHQVNEWNTKLSISFDDNSSFIENPFQNQEAQNNSFATGLKNKEKTLPIKHTEDSFSDFDHTRLLYQMNSKMGPKLAVADLNGDDLDDFYLCGAKGFPGQIFIQQQNGAFKPNAQQQFDADKQHEDVDAQFFDLDNDGDLDLYVVSGGSEFNDFSPELTDRLYINHGGTFERVKELYPVNNKLVFGSCVVAADVNQDGWVDLFVGGRQEKDYGIPTDSYLLLNNQKGSLEYSEQKEFNQLGMVTDAAFVDLNDDGLEELVVVGEYMPVTIFEFKSNQFTPISGSQNELKGWWNSVAVVDQNQDGKPDLLLGNHGQNSRFRATKTQPIRLYVNDFDRNGKVEQIVTVYNQGKSYPLALRHDLIMQLPYLKEKFLKYEDYKHATIEDIFVPEQLNNSVILEANEMRSGYLLNQNMKFDFVPFAIPAQLSCVNAITSDGSHIFLGGNQDGVKPEVGRQDASSGFAFSIDQNQLSFQDELGIKGVINDIALIRTKKGKSVLFARNNDAIVSIELQ